MREFLAAQQLRVAVLLIFLFPATFSGCKIVLDVGELPSYSAKSQANASILHEDGSLFAARNLCMIYIEKFLFSKQHFRTPCPRGSNWKIGACIRGV